LKEVQLGFINLAVVLPVIDQAGVVVDLSAATSLKILLKKPDKDRTVLTKTATAYTDLTDGKIQYLTVEGDLDTLGIWEAQADIIHPNFDGGASVQKFKVVRNISC